MRQYDALELSRSAAASRTTGSAARSYTISRLYGNYAGLANSDEISHADDRHVVGDRAAAGRQHRAPGQQRAGRAWDLDELVWDSHGNLDVLGRLATDRPDVAKLYGSYLLPFGTQVGGFFYAGSGTPMSTVVNTHQHDPGARERPRRHGPHAVADRGPTCSSRTS